jgi:hypothetical protein
MFIILRYWSWMPTSLIARASEKKEEKATSAFQLAWKSFHVFENLLAAGRQRPRGA